MPIDPSKFLGPKATSEYLSTPPLVAVEIPQFSTTQGQPTQEAQPTMTRSDCLKAALSIVEGEREATYGTPEDSFSTIAAFWRTYLQGRVAGSIDAADVGVMMMLLKVARISHRKDHLDSYIDAAAYAACAVECATRGQS